MSLFTRIQTIISELEPNATFMVSGRQEIDERGLKLTTDRFPLVIFVTEIDANSKFKTSSLLSDRKIILLFLSKDDTHSRGEESIKIFESMESLADNTLARLSQEGDLVIDGEITYRTMEVYKWFTSILSGVKIEANVKIRKSVTYCRLP